MVTALPQANPATSFTQMLNLGYNSRVRSFIGPRVGSLVPRRAIGSGTRSVRDSDSVSAAFIVAA